MFKKITMEKDFMFPLTCFLMKDGQVELATTEAKEYIGMVKRVVSLNLSLNEYDTYINKKGLDRELWIRKRVLDIIQK